MHEILEGNKLRELHRATGGTWGGNMVTKKFWDFISALVGEDVFKKFSSENKGDLLELYEDFENKKRMSDPDITGIKISLRLPSSLKDTFKQVTGSELSVETIRRSQPNIEVTGDKLRLPVSVFESFFKGAVDDITAHLHDLLESIPDTPRALLMVGGFSESLILQRKIKDEFGELLQVIIPTEASLCVLKGAVLYGYEPSMITERVVRYTYGIVQVVKFNPAEHPTERRLEIDNNVFCDNVFDVHVRKNETVKFGEFGKERVYYPMSENDTTYPIVLYRSTKSDPKFVDEEGCENVGYFLVKRVVPKGTSTRDEKVSVYLGFGNSDIRAKVVRKDGSVETLDFKF